MQELVQPPFGRQCSLYNVKTGDLVLRAGEPRFSTAAHLDVRPSSVILRDGKTSWPMFSFHFPCWNKISQKKMLREKGFILLAVPGLNTSWWGGQGRNWLHHIHSQVHRAMHIRKLSAHPLSSDTVQGPNPSNGSSHNGQVVPPRLMS